MRVIIFSHESDVDGLFSAAIGLIRYPQARTVFLGNGKEAFQTISHFIDRFVYSPSALTGGLIMICDLSLSEDTTSINLCKSSFSKAKDAGYEIAWLDHHPWSIASKVLVQSYADLELDATLTKCASELVCEKFLSRNELALTLAKMAHSMDFFKEDLYLTPISELIVYYHTHVSRYEKLSALAAKVSRGILWDLEMQKDYMLYSQLRDEAKKESYRTLEIRNFGGKFKAAIVKSSPYIQNSLFAHEILDKTRSDIAILYGPGNKVSIRRNNDQISCRQIALNFAEGGGHDFAAGAKFKSAAGDHEQIMKEFEDALSNALHDAGPS
jgi:oligoribonuclease NrnB/cAMP/cGMP phosphodiesterase (DHH superfamily)